MSESHLLTSQDGYVLTVTLNQPQRLNALTRAMAADLRRLLEDAQSDEAVRVVVLTGAGRGFCAGADLSEVAGLAGGDQRPGSMRHLMLEEAGRLAHTLYTFDKPVIAAVNGPAAGAGAALALAADVTIMAEDASVSFLFTRRGLVPDYGSTWLLPRLVGLRTARRLCLFGDAVGAAEALQLGLVDQVVPAAGVAGAARDVARRFADGPGVALRLTKRLLGDSFSTDVGAAIDREFTAQALCFASADATEGATAFLQKRPPAFTWR